MKAARLGLIGVIGWYCVLITAHYLGQRPLWNDEQCVLNNIIQMYLETTPSYLQQIETAIATGNLDSLRRATHSLGSSSATLGAINFAKLCKELENLARSGSITTAENLFLPLQTEYETVKRALTLQLKDPND